MAGILKKVVLKLLDEPYQTLGKRAVLTIISLTFSSSGRVVDVTPSTSLPCTSSLIHLIQL